MGAPTVARRPAGFGRYRIVSVVAEGGMGVVYRAEERDTRQPVALKTVAGSRLLNLECLRREIHALSRVSHPGIIRILEQGIDSGIPWYAMELVEGTSLRHLLDGEDASEATRSAGPPRARTQRLPKRGAELANILHVIRRLCAPLGFLHGEGIVHRDLKPENVVVRPSGEPVIVDFGLAAQFGGPVSREAVSAELHAELGTLGYMAPEQRRGELLDARVDIYALGCVLYEALTGQVPLSASPPQPSQVIGDVDPRLDALVMQLIAQDPRERIGYLDDVAAVLGSINEQSESRARGPAMPPSRAYLYRPSFAGRHEALAQLTSWLDGAPGGLALVHGESGTGKTRLVMEIARHAARRGLRVVTAECVPVDATADAAIQDAPLHPLRPLLRAIADHCRVGGSAVAERILGDRDRGEREWGRRGRVLAAYEPALAALPGLEGPQRVATLSPQAARARLYADLGDTLALFAREVPLLVVIDDLQWADELTLTFLAGYAERLARTGVRVLGTYRSEAGDALAQVVAVAHAEIGIRRLGGAAVAAMISDMLAIAAPPDALVRFLLDHSEGNPFFVAEYLRAAVHEGWLRRDPSGRWRVGVTGAEGALPLPDSLRELVTRRLDDVTQVAARFIDAAAVIGRDVEPAVVAGIVELGDAAELEITDELLRKHVLEELSGNRFRFAHDKLREVAYERLAAPQRCRLHGLAAGALERTRADDAPSFGVLAHHFLQAGIHVRALAYLEKAGNHALRTAAHGQARQFYARALELAGERGDVEPFRCTQWMRRMAEASFGQGDIEGSEAQATEALARLTGALPSGKLGWAALVAAGIVRQLRGWLVPGRAARSADERARSLEAALTAGQLASIYYFTGDGLRMVGLLLVGANLADRAGSPSTVVESYARLGYVAGVAGLHRAARRYFTRAHALSRGEVTGRALTLYLHSFYHLGLAQWAAAEHKAGSALTLLLDNGDRQDAEIALTIASHAVYFSGRFGEARSRYLQVLEWARARGNVQHEAWALYLLARSDLALGDVELATEELERARGLLGSFVDRFSPVICDGLLAQAYLARRDLDAAERLARALDSQLAGPVLPLAPCVDGYVGAAETYLALAEQRRDVELRGAARAAQRRLARFARAFPMARPASLRVSARCALLDDLRPLAVRRLRASVATAHQLAMPYDEAMAHAELATVEPDRARAAAHRERAHQLYVQLTARRGLALLDAIS